MLEIGQKIPLKIKVKNLQNKEVTLKKYLGQPLVIYFYPKDNTPGCTKEARSFRSNMQQLQELGVKVVGVSQDDVESHKKFKQKLNLNFELLSDESRELMKAFGVWQEKRMFGKSYMGTVRSTFAVDEKGIIIYVWPRVRPTEHAEQVLKFFQEQVN